jgi:hypothetical protein
MNVAVLVIVLHGQVTCEPQIRHVPEAAEAYCFAAERAPITSPRPLARPIGEDNEHD